MCSYLVYPSFPLIGVVGAVCVSGDQSSRCSGCKAQMVALYGAVRATVPVTPLVIPYSWRSLGTPGICSAPVEFAVSVLLWSRSLAQSCFCKCPSSWSVSAEVPCLGLVLQGSLAPVYSLRGLSLVCPDPQRSWLRPTPSEVPDSCPDPQRSLV